MAASSGDDGGRERSSPAGLSAPDYARVFAADGGGVPVEVDAIDDPVLADYTARGRSSY